MWLQISGGLPCVGGRTRNMWYYRVGFTCAALRAPKPSII